MSDVTHIGRHVCEERSEQPEGLPPVTEAPKVCPACGGCEFEEGYGCAGGGMGAYLICIECLQVVAKTQDCVDG